MTSNFPLEVAKEIKKIVESDLTCPVCLCVMTQTHTFMECMHRFCQDCINRALRIGQKECPSCRKKCATRRNLRDDSRFDALISALDFNPTEAEAETLVQAEKYLKSKHHQAFTESVKKAKLKQNYNKFSKEPEWNVSRGRGRPHRDSISEPTVPEFETSLYNAEPKYSNDIWFWLETHNSALGNLPLIKIYVVMDSRSVVSTLSSFICRRIMAKDPDEISLIIRTKDAPHVDFFIIDASMHLKQIKELSTITEDETGDSFTIYFSVNQEKRKLHLEQEHSSVGNDLAIQSQEIFSGAHSNISTEQSWTHNLFGMEQNQYISSGFFYGYNLQPSQEMDLMQTFGTDLRIENEAVDSSAISQDEINSIFPNHFP